MFLRHYARAVAGKEETWNLLQASGIENWRFEAPRIPVVNLQQGMTTCCQA